MMKDYYEMLVTCTGSAIGTNEFSVFDDFEKVFDTPEEVRKWLKEHYGNARVKYSYINVRGKETPAGYVFMFENADWSHSPVERWDQIDWVNVSKIHAENAIEEIGYEIPEDN